MCPPAVALNPCLCPTAFPLLQRFPHLPAIMFTPPAAILQPCLQPSHRHSKPFLRAMHHTCRLSSPHACITAATLTIIPCPHNALHHAQLHHALSPKPWATAPSPPLPCSLVDACISTTSGVKTQAQLRRTAGTKSEGRQWMRMRDPQQLLAQLRAQCHACCEALCLHPSSLLRRQAGELAAEHGGGQALGLRLCSQVQQG